VIVDTSVLLAYFDSAEPANVACTEVIEACPDELVVSPYVIAEVDYLLTTRVGVTAELAVLAELAGGAWELPAFSATDLRSAAKVMQRYSEQPIGVADASNVVLAAHYQTRAIATLDRRHFNVLRPLTGGRFTIVP
jgi:uncharacterized protein